MTDCPQPAYSLCVLEVSEWDVAELTRTLLVRFVLTAGSQQRVCSAEGGFTRLDAVPTALRLPGAAVWADTVAEGLVAWLSEGQEP